MTENALSAHSEYQSDIYTLSNYSLDIIRISIQQDDF